LIFGLLAIAAFAMQDASDTLANRFLFKSAEDRRAMIDAIYIGPTPTQIFQLAYGLKRQKQYDVIRAYFHPNIADIVLYGSYSFYIQYDRKASRTNGEWFDGGVDTTQGSAGNTNLIFEYYLSAHRYFDQDKRDELSTYVNVHSAGWGAKRWKLTPVATTFAGTGFYISLVVDEHKYDGINQAGWYLSLQRLVAFDKGNHAIPANSANGADRTRVIVHAPPVETNVWVLTPVDRGDSFLMQLGTDDNMFDAVDQSKWFLDVVTNPQGQEITDRRPGNAALFDDSYYVSAMRNPAAVAQAHNSLHSWRITFGG